MLHLDDFIHLSRFSGHIGLAVAGAVLTAVLLIRQGALHLFRALRLGRSTSWVAAPAIIESGEVEVRRGGISQDLFIEFADAILAYSYRVDGEYYAGYYRKAFFGEQRAWDFVDSWKRCSVTIRHDPRNPERSTLCLKEQVDFSSPRVR